MKKVIFLLLLYLLNNIIPSNSQAMHNDQYMDELDWYRFNTSRANNPDLSDQSRWEASQLAVQNIANMERKYGSGCFGSTPTAHDIYRNVDDRRYDSTLSPPLSSNQGTYYHPSSQSRYYQPSSQSNYSSPSVNFSQRQEKEATKTQAVAQRSHYAPEPRHNCFWAGYHVWRDNGSCSYCGKRR